jgi:hypothetical protein
MSTLFLPCLCLQLEKAQKDPARVQLLYERALAVFPVTSDLWLQYTRYLEAVLKVPALINKVRGRQILNFLRLVFKTVQNEQGEAAAQHCVSGHQQGEQFSGNGSLCSW